MFKMLMVVINLAAGQASGMEDQTVYPTFEKCVAAIPGKLASAKDEMSKPQAERKVFVAIGCARFDGNKLPGA